MKAVFAFGKQMKPTILLEGKDDFAGDFQAVSLLQSHNELKFCPLPIPTEKAIFKSWLTNLKEPIQKSFDFKDHILEVLEVVHGSSLTKAQLAKEVQEKVPSLNRKSQKIKQFLTDYCDRATETINSTDSQKRL